MHSDSSTATERVFACARYRPQQTAISRHKSAVTREHCYQLKSAGHKHKQHTLNWLHSYLYRFVSPYIYELNVC